MLALIRRRPHATHSFHPAALPVRAALAHEQCRVSAIDSGDRLTCRGDDGLSRSIHLRGIEAPDEPFAQRARETLQRLA
ncbi:hypothetical protein D0N87_07300, partial [Pseudomonas sp. ATCC 13867]